MKAYGNAVAINISYSTIPVHLHYEVYSSVNNMQRMCCVCIRTGMYALVRIKAGFLRKSFEAEIALEGTFASMRAHVNLQVRLAAESCVANLGAYATSLYLEGSPFNSTSAKPKRTVMT